ncbi:hypothetical protein ABH942_002524 [Flavobacterium sp. 28YEA47A]|uniref:Arm DNA-binding domain-containing protein n=1 Tax=Flavobacterium sp. 28YEA47A TaxID=3156276 RepID=UPI003516BF93
MKAKVSLHFYAKSTKANTKGQFPIYVRLTVDGNRTEFSTKKFIEPSRDGHLKHRKRKARQRKPV